MVKNSGRPITAVDDTFYVRSPDVVMVALSALKNAGRTWSSVATEIGYSGSATNVWKVAKGLSRSKEIERCLGLGPAGRVRWAGDLPAEVRAELQQERERLNTTNGELLQLLWLNYKNGSS